jgi:hypothetical protein
VWEVDSASDDVGATPEHTPAGDDPEGESPSGPASGTDGGWEVEASAPPPGEEVVAPVGEEPAPTAAEESAPAAGEEPAPVTQEEPAPVAEEKPAPGEDVFLEESFPPLPTPAAEEPATRGSSAAAFTFGRRDPHDKARRLARVLVSDMIMYNPDRHSRAIAARSLREDFEDEIRKSWEEYVEQVGEELARGTSYFDDALNDILAGGERVFP